MALRKYKKLVLCSIFLILPSLSGCLGVSESFTRSSDSDFLTQSLSKTKKEAAILSAYSIQANFPESTPSLANLKSLHLATATFSEADYLKIAMKVGVFKVSKQAFIAHLKKSMDYPNVPRDIFRKYVVLYNFLADEVKRLGAVTVNTSEEIAAFYFDLLVKEHILIPFTEAKDYIDVTQVYPNLFSGDEYLVFSPDHNSVMKSLLDHSLKGKDPEELGLSEMRILYAVELATLITGGLNDLTSPDYLNRVYVDLKATRYGLPLRLDADGMYSSVMFKLPVGRVVVDKFEIYNAEHKAIFSVPHKNKHAIAMLLDEGNALPWVEVIRKNQITVRKSTTIQVVPMNSLEEGVE